PYTTLFRSATSHQMHKFFYDCQTQATSLFTYIPSILNLEIAFKHTILHRFWHTDARVGDLQSYFLRLRFYATVQINMSTCIGKLRSEEHTSELQSRE